LTLLHRCSCHSLRGEQRNRSWEQKCGSSSFHCRLALCHCHPHCCFATSASSASSTAALILQGTPGAAGRIGVQNCCCSQPWIDCWETCLLERNSIDDIKNINQSVERWKREMYRTHNGPSPHTFFRHSLIKFFRATLCLISSSSNSTFFLLCWSS
jgi:hypothetical protein